MIATVKTLTTHLDDRGYLYEMLRADDPFFQRFGQVYLSATYPDVVKGFHQHQIQTDHIVCVQGQIKLVLIQEANAFGATEGEVEEHHLSPMAPKMIVIPPGIWHGWMCISEEPALVVNISSHVFNREKPDEDRVNPHENPWGYEWGIEEK